jgi:hypothetical protein
MTFQATDATEFSAVLIEHFPFIVGEHNCLIKIDEMGSRGNSVGIMTNRARCPLLNNMLPVLRETFIGQKRVTVMAFIAECIGLWILGG